MGPLEAKGELDMGTPPAAAAATAIGDQTEPDFAVNTGVANSAMGNGTALPELVARMRFLNVIASILVLSAYSVPTALSSTLLLRPLRLVIAVAAGAVAFLIAILETRVPVLCDRIARTFGTAFDSALGRGAWFVLIGICACLDGWLPNHSFWRGVASPLGWGLVSLGGYTYYVCLKFPQYARWRLIVPGGDGEGITSSTGGIGGIIGISDSLGGYGAIPTPSWANTGSVNA